MKMELEPELIRAVRLDVCLSGWGNLVWTVMNFCEGRKKGLDIDPKGPSVEVNVIGIRS